MDTQFTSVLTTAPGTGGSPDVTEPWKIPTGLKLRAGATESHLRRRTAAEDRPGHTPESGRPLAMEQRLAEFREARKRASLLAQPSTSSQSVQTSGAEAEPAAATPKTGTGWLRRFLKWKTSSAPARAQPNQPQVRREACTSKLRLRVGPRPALHKPHPRFLALGALPSLVRSLLACAVDGHRISSMFVSTRYVALTFSVPDTALCGS